MAKGRLLVTVSAIVGICALAFVQLWTHRFDVYSNDTIAYLDLSDRVRDGDWAGLVNSYWSPLYPVLLGVAARWITLPLDYGFALQQAVNGILFVFQLGAFIFLLRSNDLCGRGEGASGSDGVDYRAAVAYGVLYWSTLCWLPAWYGGPDVLVSGFLFLTVACLLRQRAATTASAQVRAGSAAGLCLGLGYLSKAIFFPIALWVVLMQLWAVARRKVHPMSAFGCAALFASLAFPWLVALKQHENHWTFGESGKLNYMWFVSPCRDKIGQGPWVEPCAGAGTAARPARQVMSHPRVNDLTAAYPRATEPFWYDPPYWQAGLSPTFSLDSQLEIASKSVGFIWTEIGRALLALLAVVMFLNTPSKRASAISRCLGRFCFSVPASIGSVGLALYAVGMRMDWAFLGMRYLAGFAVLLFLAALFAGDARAGTKRIQQVICLVGAALLLGATWRSVSTWDPYWSRYWRAHEPSAIGELADRLHQLGVGPGTSIAASFYGGAPLSVSQVARLAEVHIAAMVGASIWKEDFDERFAVYAALRGMGIQYLLSSIPHKWTLRDEGWIPLGDLGFALLRLDQVDDRHQTKGGGEN